MTQWKIRTRFTHDGWAYVEADTPELAMFLHGKGDWAGSDLHDLADWEPLGDPEENK